MNPEDMKGQPWWNTDLLGDEEPATTTSEWVAAMSPRIVLVPR